MKNNLAVSYALKRRSSKQSNPKLEQAEKMAEGGMVEDEDDKWMANNTNSETGSEEEGNMVSDLMVKPHDDDNQFGDPASKFYEDMDEAKMETTKKKGMLLSMILSGIKKAHSGAA